MTHHVTITWADRMYPSAQVYLLRLTGTAVGHNSGILFSHVCPDLFWSYNFICCLRDVFTAALRCLVAHIPLYIFLFIHLLTFNRSWRGQTGGKSWWHISVRLFCQVYSESEAEVFCGELWNKVGSYLLICTVCLCDLIITTSVNFVLPCDPGSLKSPSHVRP